MMSALLRSPLSHLVDRSVALLTVVGRRTGRTYTFPVQYVQEGDALWIISGAGPAKTWWRNLVDGASIEILFRRTARQGQATAYTYAADPAAVIDGLHRYLNLFPRMARRMGIQPGDEEALTQAARQTVIVRVDLLPVVVSSSPASQTSA
jgi:deazaflavin-dependent oxidoreductase (nitroreductase family)